MRKSEQIQALRGLAVTGVVFFHAKSMQFPNGWIGVDVFFVISGFLMWHLYCDSLLEGHQSQFYIKRLRRLIPALAFTIIISLVVFFLRTLPHERYSLITESLSATLGISNVYYWFEVQYFANSQLRPLLNLWSISLELQFYILFPFLVLLIKKSITRMIILFSVSFATYLILSLVSFQSSFYLLPGRLWQFTAGMLVALALSDTQRKVTNYRKFGNTFMYFLTFLVIIPFKFDSLSMRMLLQITIVFLTAMIIMRQYGKIESNKFILFFARIGDYSYSIYLIHFPLLILFGYQKFSGNAVQIYKYQDTGIYFAILIIFSFVMKRFIEDISVLKRKFLTIWFITLVISAVFSFTKLSVVGLGYDVNEQSISMAKFDRGEFRCGIMSRLPLLNSPSKVCKLGKDKLSEKKVLLVGNSHTDSIKEAVVNSIPDQQVFLLNENNPIGKANYANYILGVKVVEPSLVIIHNSGGSVDLEYLRKYIRFLIAGGIRVLIIDPIPHPGFDVPKRMFETYQRYGVINNLVLDDFNLDRYSQENAVELSFHSKLETEFGIERLKVAPTFCKPNCLVFDSKTKKPFYFDSGHLTLTGASLLVDLLKGTLQKKFS